MKRWVKCYEMQDGIAQPAITCSNLTMKTAKRRHWLHSDVFIINFEHISHLVLLFLLLTLTM